ncbi:DoxX family protein [Agilicoccus flavus]|uniref:DoxX family protein n=1 Tax=Agilicoccus flavus TaxID=2775968 RepID=UPI0027DA6C81|nr:hypothetical protein [Agilicoccus flavus]
MTDAPTPRGRRTAYALAALCGGMGVLHQVKPEPFDALIPRSLPGSARAWTYGSGVVELVTAALLAYPPTRRRGGRLATLLFLGVFPGNLQMAWNWRHLPWQRQLVSLGRLPLQADLVRRSELVAREG